MFCNIFVPKNIQLPFPQAAKKPKVAEIWNLAKKHFSQTGP
jgi:hypothetical protein